MCSYLYLFADSLYLSKPLTDGYLKDFQFFVISNETNISNLQECYFMRVEVSLQGKFQGLRFYFVPLIEEPCAENKKCREIYLTQ